MLQGRTADVHKAMAPSTVKREDTMIPSDMAGELKKQPLPRPPGVSEVGGVQTKRKA